MNVPNRLNHRRRVVYAALRKALDRDQRIPKLFIFWDRSFATLEHFVISPYTEQAAGKGWLNDQEKRALTRALMYFMSHTYEELPKYPDEFVNIKPKNPLVQDLPKPEQPQEPPIIKEVQVVEEARAAMDAQAPKDAQAVKDAQALKELRDSSVTLKQLRMSSVRKVTITPEMMPHYLVFREVMAVLLKSLRESVRPRDDVHGLVFVIAVELGMNELEPLLQSWSEQDFSLDELPILVEQTTTEQLVQLFYHVACEISKPSANKTALIDRVKVSEIPEIIR
jgi:hypothetical protein